MLTHAGEKPFTCNLFEFKTWWYIYRWKAILLQFMWIQNCSERWFKASYVDAHRWKAIQNCPEKSLKFHIVKIYAGKKPFSGNFCEFKEDIKEDESSMETKQEEISTIKMKWPAALIKHLRQKWKCYQQPSTQRHVSPHEKGLLLVIYVNTEVLEYYKIRAGQTNHISSPGKEKNSRPTERKA